MTVRELIELLKKQPQDVPVWTEGCDCDGQAGGVALEETGPGSVFASQGPVYVMIKRA